MFELAKQAETIKHHVWSNLDNVIRVRSLTCRLPHWRLTMAAWVCWYDAKYHAEQYACKCCVADLMQAQESTGGDKSMSRGILTSGPHTDMLSMVSPYTSAEQVPPVLPASFPSSLRWNARLRKPHAPVVALQDLGCSRSTFPTIAPRRGGQDPDRSRERLGRLDVLVQYLVSTFTKVTDKRAEYVPFTIDEWMGLILDIDRQVARDDGAASCRDNFIPLGKTSTQTM
ncbi:hypothetical protein C8T65DRAFT_774456 [Cerioporus squamosus]|nr:hypothetical protein C8T65DRAFT_774456 [Cerioporus squamosus]